MGYELSEFVGEEEDAVAAKLITAVKDETATSTKGDVNAHGKVFGSPKPKRNEQNCPLRHQLGQLSRQGIALNVQLARMTLFSRESRLPRRTERLKMTISPRS